MIYSMPICLLLYFIGISDCVCVCFRAYTTNCKSNFESYQCQSWLLICFVFLNLYFFFAFIFLSFLILLKWNFTISVGNFRLRNVLEIMNTGSKSASSIPRNDRVKKETLSKQSFLTIWSDRLGLICCI